MQTLISYALILCFVLPCLCLRQKVETKNVLFNVNQYGAFGDGKSDDSQAFLKAWNSACGAEGITTLVIPQGKSFMVKQLILDGAICKAQNIHIQLEGEIIAPSRAAWEVGQYWITIQHVNGLTIDGNGGIDGDGSTWWTCNNCQRPVALFFLHCNDLIVRGLRISNTPETHIAIATCNRATFSNISINSPFDSPNTDGFDISDSNNILIEDSNIRCGDDCIAINSGSTYINATRVTCGPGHGISIGSLGKQRAHATVEDVYIKNCTFIGTSNGARIKTIKGGSGYARRITFEHIQLINVKNPIIIDQHYDHIQDSTLKVRDVIYRGIHGAVQVSDVTYREINGTSIDDTAIYFDCSNLGCDNIVLDQINIISSQPGRKTRAFCRYAHGTVKSTIPNVSCLNNIMALPI